MRSLTLLSFLLASQFLLAQKTDSTRAPEKTHMCSEKNPEEPCSIPPHSITATDADHSKEAKGKGVLGTVTLVLVVDVDGKAHDLRVVKSLGSGLDEKAIEAVKQWRFKPGTHMGKPVPVLISLEVEFHYLN